MARQAVSRPPGHCASAGCSQQAPHRRGQQAFPKAPLCRSMCGTPAAQCAVRLPSRVQGNRERYYAAANSLLDAVLTNREGLPISLALLLAAVRDRVLRHAAAGSRGRACAWCWQ